MPSAPNPDSPYMDSRLQATFGVKAPGSPSSAGKPGVQAADVSFPAPPAPASAPAGRPSATPTPAPIAAPAAPPSSAGSEIWPDAQQPAAPKTEKAAPVAPPQQAGSEIWPDAQAPVVPAPSVVATKTALDQPELAITPEGAQRYRELVVRGREALGPIPNILRSPGMPELPFEPGKQNYNPFTGRWSS